MVELDIEGYNGTEYYHQGWLNVKLTDGCAYLMKHDCAWLITDICTILKINKEVTKEPFVSIELKKIADTKAVAVYTDGNNKVLYMQKYLFTDIWTDNKLKNINFFYYNNVLMLSSEY